MLKRIAIYLPMLFMLSCCEEKQIVRDNEKINGWIHGIMENNYLWSRYMPDDWEERLDSPPRSFFNRLLYFEHEDLELNDIYSRIIYTGNENENELYQTGSEYAAEAPTYHFGFAARLLSPTNTFCHVTYVIPNSPADRQGIKRGDCFKTVNGENITQLSQLEKMMENTRIELGFYYPEERTVKLTKSFYTDNPVFLDSIYDLTPKTGYLVYNHFTDGDNNKYYNDLLKVFSRFHTEQVENIIVDLRFNGGGELNAARKLTSLLAPEESLGDVYLYKERKSTYGMDDLFEAERLSSSSQMQGYNCGLKGLYFLTNKNTASASELVIHCLRPLYENAGLKFVHVGEVTEGKNVGGEWYSNSLYEWEFYAITLRVYNINKESGYESGLVADIGVSEYSNDDINTSESGYPYITLGQLGDISEELMLRRAMDDIYGVGGWQDLLPQDQRTSQRPESRAVSASYSPLNRGDGARTTVKYRPLTERHK